MIKTPKTTFLFIILYFLSLNNTYAQLTLETIFLKHEYSPEALDDVAFYSKNEMYAMLHEYPNYQKIINYNTKAEKISEINLKNIWDNHQMPNKTISQFQLSNTDKYFLLTTDVEYIFRHSTIANHYLLANNIITPIDDDKIQYLSFSPDDTKVSYIKNNNIYYKNLKNNKITQITKDGQYNTIINGKSDWVYEEEFQLTQAYTWSNDGSKIAYLKFDESKVKEYSFPLYYGASYPQLFSYKYPKVGEENSKVTLHYYDLKKNKNYAIKIPFSFEYLPKLFFNNNSTKIYYLLMNRWQNEMYVYAYDVQNKKHHLIYSEISKTYIDLPTFLLLHDDSFFITSEKENYNQIYHYDANGKLINKITKGSYNVKDILAFDVSNNKLYFSASISKLEEKHIYVVDVLTQNLYQLTQETGTHKIYFAPQMTYYIHQHSADDVPTQTKIMYNNNSSSTMLLDNLTLKNKTDSIPKKEFLKININDYTLESYIIYPTHFDSTQQYPLLMMVYGGPGSQEVENKFGSSIDMWQKYLANLGYIVACVDNRGCGGKSASFKNATYLQLGKIETEDQIAVAKYFSNFPFINKNRIGIMGWSYGGYLSLLCLAQGNEIFKTAISIAPVTNWLWYDNIYTERYMKSPSENKNGYFNGNVLLHAHKIKGNLLLIHGTADDNVHMQHTYELISKLNQLNIPFQNYIYTDKNHGISGGNTRYNLFSKITHYILNNL